MICRTKWKRVLRGRNHAERYPGGLIEAMNWGVTTRSCAAQPRSDRKTLSIYHQLSHKAVELMKAVLKLNSAPCCPHIAARAALNFYFG